MGLAINKRSVMTLYTDPGDSYCHRIRLVLAEKGINAEIIEVLPGELPEDLLHLNPYGTVPVIVDRDLVLYEPNIIAEYLDERFPHPPLLPVYPVARAKHRQMMHRIERDWYSLMKKIENYPEKEAKSARKQLLDSLLSVAPLFAGKPYFMSDEFTLVDCCIAPLLWRLPKLGLELPNTAKSIKAYMQRVFDRPTFKTSLTEVEQELATA